MKETKVESCLKNIVVLLESGVCSTQDIVLELIDTGYGVKTVEKALNEFNGKIKPSCSDMIHRFVNIVDTTNKSGYTKYSLGEIREEIVRKGYPVDLVNECLIQELSNQYISLS